MSYYLTRLPSDVSLALVAKSVPIALTFVSDAVIVGAHLLIDSGKIDQVLQNLLTNAVRMRLLLYTSY